MSGQETLNAFPVRQVCPRVPNRKDDRLGKALPVIDVTALDWPCELLLTSELPVNALGAFALHEEHKRCRDTTSKNSHEQVFAVVLSQVFNGPALRIKRGADSVSSLVFQLVATRTAWHL
jgi:hypothetical protein